MTIRVRVEHGQDAGKTFRLSARGVYIVGRHPSSSFRVLDMKVSKAHCEFHLIDSNGNQGAFFSKCHGKSPADTITSPGYDHF